MKTTLNRLFPFHLIFSKDGLLCSFGPSTEKCFKNIKINIHEGELFKTLLPKGVDVIADAAKLNEKVVTIESISTKIRFSGEVILIPETEEIVLAISPVIQDLSTLSNFGLSYRDFPIYSPVFDFYILIQAERFSRQELQRSFKTLESFNTFAKINIDIANFCSKSNDFEEAINYVFKILQDKLAWEGRIELKKTSDCQEIKLENNIMSICLNSSTGSNFVISFSLTEHLELSEALKFFCTSMKATLENVISRMEQYANAQEVQAQKVMSSKMYTLGEMAASIAHELNNPMAVIQGVAWMTQASAQSGELLPDKISENMTKIIKMTERSSKIIKGVRIFARDGGDDPIEPIELNSIIEDTLELCKWRINQKGIQLIWDSKDAALSSGKPVQISQVLLNLLNNATDAIEGSKDPWIKINLEEQNENWIVSVTDSGKGIPPEVVKKMMVPFFTTKASGKGTGLGLSISQKIMKDHNGKMWYEEDSSNTKFSFSLPILKE
jgi:C4-dicarboxylate-specific signal transduction histidine kinase